MTRTSISTAYSFWQYRFYIAALGIFFFVKFLFVLIAPGSDGFSIAHRFAAASALLLAINLVSCYGLLWSLAILECAWLYVFLPTDIIDLTFVSLLLVFPALVSLQSLALKKGSSFTDGKSWRMPAWIFYSAQFLFLLSLTAWAFAQEYGSLALMQSLFFLFVFDPRWLAPVEFRSKQKPILFFDGVCVLCNRWVDLVFSEDYQHTFRFSPLQGKTAAAMLSKEDIKDTKYLLLYDKGTVYQGSAALLKIGQKLGGLWRLGAILGRCIPKPMRQSLYKYLAARRYKWFGRLQQCRLPSPTERSYFLD